VHHIAGVDDPYEAPLAPELCCHTDRETIAESTAKVVSLILRLI
jgi:adenylylsulfate kinase-like enzyme